MKTTALERAAKLEAEAKAIRRAEKQFWDDIAERADEVKLRLGMSDNSDSKWDEICRTYSAYTADEKEALYKHIVSDKQVNYYNRSVSTYKPEDSAASSF